jgi:hypothetical protein
VAFTDVEDLDAARETVVGAGATERDAPRQVAQERASACSLTRTESDRPARKVADMWRCRRTAAGEVWRLVCRPGGYLWNIRYNSRGRNELYAE